MYKDNSYGNHERLTIERAIAKDNRITELDKQIMDLWTKYGRPAVNPEHNEVVSEIVDPEAGKGLMRLEYERARLVAEYYTPTEKRRDL